jgi:predicted ATPase
MDHIQRAFPDQIEDLEFDTLGQAIMGRFYPAHAPSPDDSLPVHLAADGLLTGLLHLTAVAGARPGSIVAFDEMENQLHPHAIRSILASMRERADEHDLTILLTTHSPVLMNEFKGHENQFFVLDRDARPSPTPLDELKDPDWLAHFALGDLYERMDFAAPSSTDDASSKTRE